MTPPRCVVAVLPARRPCPDPPASPLGFCARHLRDAAAEAARLAAPPAPADGPRPEAVPFRSLCTRCGRPGHDWRRCDA